MKLLTFCWKLSDELNLYHFFREDNLARITIEDCMKRIPNRFILVQMAATRVRQIREGDNALVHSPKNEDVVIALREIAADKLYVDPTRLPGIEAYMDMYDD